MSKFDSGPLRLVRDKTWKCVSSQSSREVRKARFAEMRLHVVCRGSFVPHTHVPARLNVQHQPVPRLESERKYTESLNQFDCKTCPPSVRWKTMHKKRATTTPTTEGRNSTAHIGSTHLP
ncbi:unnamed protein product, partial [Ectocarpus sp. 4 AP-2014]